MRIRIVWSKVASAGIGPQELVGEVMVSTLTDPGCHRELNEDCVRVVQPDDPETALNKGMLAVVADGMGGHQAGEVASGLAVDAICREYFNHAADVPEALAEAFEKANREIYEQSATRQSLGGMGTTCTALAIAGSRAWAGHIGDSRLYLIRQGEIYRMTEDHSAVMDLVKKGILSADEAHHHADRNVLLRAMGLRPSLEAEIWKEAFPLRPGDRFMLCSDGLHDLIEDYEIRDILLRLDPDAACAELVSLARERGGFDNISVVALEIRASAAGAAA